MHKRSGSCFILRVCVPAILETNHRANRAQSVVPAYVKATEFIPNPIPPTSNSHRSRGRGRDWPVAFWQQGKDIVHGDHRTPFSYIVRPVIFRTARVGRTPC